MGTQRYAARIQIWLHVVLQVLCFCLPYDGENPMKYCLDTVICADSVTPARAPQPQVSGCTHYFSLHLLTVRSVLQAESAPEGPV